MKSIRLFAASSALLLVLSTATPALAHGDRDNDRDNDHKIAINLGSILKDLRNEHKSDKRTKHATTTVSIAGTVHAISGSTITLLSEKGAQYTVNAASSTVNGSSDASMLAKIRVGDKIVVKGSLSGSVITGSKITDNALRDRLSLAEVNGVRGGTITAVSGNTITVDRFGMGTTSVITNANTFYLAGGSATSSGALKVGSQILVFGPTTTGTTDSISASVVFLLSHSVSFLKGLFR